jgi:hypothetical protein
MGMDSKTGRRDILRAFLAALAVLPVMNIKADAKARRRTGGRKKKGGKSGGKSREKRQSDWW